MISYCKIESLLELPSMPPLIDVRSPGEYLQGHIPQAINIPLLNNAERAHVGTVYKHQGQEQAIEVGLRYVVPKLDQFIVAVQNQVSSRASPIAVHCWRGGMRSQRFAEHLHAHGYVDIRVITGGYKAYRRHILNAFVQTREILILGGYTGSGKTHILQALRQQGEQVIDLEALACHKGSSFGTIRMGEQPTTEQFANNLYEALRHTLPTQRLWIEDESISIGRVQIPVDFFEKMKQAPTLFIDMPPELRAEILIHDYQHDCDELLIAAIHRITRKLGGQNAQAAIAQIHEGNYKMAALTCLRYYDRLYQKGLNKKSNTVYRIPVNTTDTMSNMNTIREYAKRINYAR